MPFFIANQNNIYYKIAGCGPPVVFIAGTAATHQSWGYQFFYLYKWFRLIAMDNRGTGQSDASMNDLSIDDMALDIDALLNAIDVDKVHLVGFSMGGMIALEYASKHPDKVSSLVLSSLPIEQPPEIIELFARDITTASLQSACSDSVFKMLAPYLFSPDFLKDRRFEIMADCTTNNVVEYDEQTILSQSFAIKEWLFSKKWEQGCQCPCLLVFGSEDKFIPLDAALEGSAKFFPHATIKIIQGAGHAVHIEKSDEFNKILFDFLVNQTNLIPPE